MRKFISFLYGDIGPAGAGLLSLTSFTYGRFEWLEEDLTGVCIITEEV